MSRSLATLLWTTLIVITVNAAAQEPPVMLRVKPELCITSKLKQSCDTSFLVEWESRHLDHYCLNDDFSSTPLRCWQKKSSGNFAQERTVIRSFSYLLTQPDHDQVLAEARVELMSIDSPDRRRNRRNRHAWSIR